MLLRSQVVTEYADGTVTAVNGSTNETMRAAGFELPPNGYAGWTRDGAVEVFSGLVDGHRVDRAKAPRYVLLNGRGKWTRFPEGATDGLVVRLLRPEGEDVFLHSATAVELPFAARSVTRLDTAGHVLGVAEFSTDGNRTRIAAQDACSYSVKR